MLPSQAIHYETNTIQRNRTMNEILVDKMEYRMCIYIIIRKKSNNFRSRQF